MNQKQFLFSIVMMILLSLVNSQQCYNNGPASYRNQTWMSTLDFGLSLRQISILGTHNSVGRSNCAWLGSFQQCQANSLQVQLQSGIRALDIRIKHNNDRFEAYDRSCSLGVNFDTILTAVKTFLTSYPSETVLMHVVEEQSASGCSRSVQDTFKFYRDSYPGLFWIPTSQDPQLGEVRGQIVLIQQFNSIQIHGLLYATFNTLSNKKFSTNWDLYNKWMDVKSFMANANTVKKSQISFWTGHGGSYPYFVASGKSSNGNGDPRLATGLTTPGFKSKYPDFPRVACFIGICTIAFQGINILGYNYIVNQNFAYTGIVYVDFYGDDLLKRILGRNTAVYAKCTLTQTSQGCTLCSLAGVCLKCNTLMHYVYDPVNKNCLAQKGYYLNSTYIPVLCSTPMPGCLECSDQTTCLNCDEIVHYLLFSGECIAEPGYYLDSSNNSFPVECPQTGCEECSDAVVCTICQDATNYILDNSTGISCKCDDTQFFVQAPSTQACICMVSYYLTSNNTCQGMPKCPSTNGGCLNCQSGTNICLLCDTANNFQKDPTNTYCICEPLYFFTGSTCSLCNTADAACDQCANQNLCLSCVDNFTLTKGMCECSFGYYQVDNDTCNICTVGCLKCTGEGQCSICDSTNNFTLVGGYCECIKGMFEQNGVCHVCGAMAGCVDCNNDGCIACDSIFGFSLDNATDTCACDYGFFINNMNICQKCMMQGCLNCISQDICTQCDTNLYYLDNSTNTCEDICGDGYLFYVDCDDGNLINGDGCSSSCTVQKDFTCVGGSPNSPSVCSYSGPIYLTIEKTLKQQTQNKVQIFMKIQPILLAYDTLNFSDVILPQFSYQTKTLFYDKNTGSIQLVFTYNQSLNSKTSDDLQINFNPPTGQPAYYYMQVAQVKLPSVTNNNLALKYYDQSIYQLYQMMNTLTTVTALIYIGVFFVCFIFISKLIAIELILVPQVTYAGLIMIEKLQSLLLPLKNLKYVNGYNPLFTDNVQLPPRISILDYKGDFLSNFNLNFVFIILVVIIGLIFLAIGKFKDNKTIRSWSYKTLKEWTFHALLLFQFQFTISFGIDFLYGSGMIGKVIGVILIISLIVMMVLLYKKPSKFGQFKSFFEKQTRHLNYYILGVIVRLILAITLIFLSQMNACGFIAISIIVINILYLIICRPYLKNIRPIVNLSFMVIILAIQSYYKLNFYSQQSTFVTNYLPLVIIGLLLILVLLNIIFILLHFKQNQKKQKIVKYQLNDDESFDFEMKKQFEKQLKVVAQIQMALSPSNINKLTQREQGNLDSSRILMNKPSNLKNLKNILKHQKKLQPLSIQNSKIYGDI